MGTGQWVLLALVLLVVGFAVYRAATDGRFRRTSRADAASVLTDSGIDVRLGERATLLLFSSASSAPCRAARRVLGEVVGVVPGVTQVEVDAEQHLAAVRALRVLRTPTTLILDREGREVSRAAGLPQRDRVVAALASVE